MIFTLPSLCLDVVDNGAQGVCPLMTEVTDKQIFFPLLLRGFGGKRDIGKIGIGKRMALL